MMRTLGVCAGVYGFLFLGGHCSVTFQLSSCLILAARAGYQAIAFKWYPNEEPV